MYKTDNTKTQQQFHKYITSCCDNNNMIYAFKYTVGNNKSALTSHGQHDGTAGWANTLYKVFTQNTCIYLYTYIYVYITYNVISLHRYVICNGPNPFSELKRKRSICACHRKQKEKSDANTATVY